jgi:hypothetical protein
VSWNGSGTYSRGYASWTNDANSGLAISATKFDLEDNDFAAGIQNCLTIDGQNKPNATLTWAQALNLTKASDANVFSLARTGGTNNPSLTWAVTDAGGFTQTLSFGSYNLTMPSGNSGFSFANAAYTFGNITDAPTFGFTGKGMTIAVDTSTRTALNLQAIAAGVSALQFNNSAAVELATIGTAGGANQIITGTAAGDFALRSKSGNIFFSKDDGATISAGLTAGGVWAISDNAASPTLYNAGYMDCPQNLQNGNYGLLLSDRGKSILHNNAAGHTYTIPANGSVAFPVGTTIVISNTNAGGTVTIAITTDTLTWAANGSTGSRTLAANGICSIHKQTSTGWLISGTGLT